MTSKRFIVEMDSDLANLLKNGGRIRILKEHKMPKATPKSLISTAPKHIVTRYLRGGCWVLAPILAKKLKLPLYGIRDTNGDIHHAFVADVENDVAYDIRGKIPLDQIATGSMAEYASVVPISLNDILKIVGSFDEEDVKEAKKVVKNFLR